MKPCNCEQAQELTELLKGIRFVIFDAYKRGAVHKNIMVTVGAKIHETLNKWSEK